MKRLTVVSCVLLLVAGIVGGVVLWRSSGVRVFNGHTMGESGNDFAKIEAKRNQIDLDKCDDIGRPEKRHFCDELVQITDAFEKAHSDESYITFGRPSRRRDLTYGEADHIHAQFDQGGRLVKLTVEHVGKQDERLYHERRGVYKAVLEDMTAQFGTSSSVREPDEKTSHPTASWFISPHTEITFEGSDFGDGTVEYTYVEKSPEAAKEAIEHAVLKPVAPAPSPAPAVGGGGQFSQKALEAIKSGDAYAALPLLKPVIRRVFGKDDHLFFDNAQTFLPSSNPQNGNGAVLFEFCRAHFCTEYESILFVDTNEGKAAGVLINEGKAYPYPGDYGTQANWPQPLKDWWNKTTE